MNLENMNKWLTLLANIGVVAGIVFLGVEINQNSKGLDQNTAAVTSESAYQLNLALDNRYRMMAQDPRLAELVTTGYDDPDSLNELEKAQFEGWIRADLNMSEAAWFSLSKGLIAEEDFNGYMAATCDRVNSPGGQWFWRQHSDKYASGFVDDVSEWC